MALGGSPEDIRLAARRVRAHAQDVDAVAARVRSGQGVTWVGTAAERYRERLREHARAIETTRGHVDDLAVRLDELAGDLEERQRAVARATDAVEDVLSSARSTLGRLAGVVRDELTDAERQAEDAARAVLDTVREPPPLGHPDWLDVARRLGR